MVFLNKKSNKITAIEILETHQANEFIVFLLRTGVKVRRKRRHKKENLQIIPILFNYEKPYHKNIKNCSNSLLERIWI
jgi:hypothetical protein